MRRVPGFLDDLYGLSFHPPEGASLPKPHFGRGHALSSRIFKEVNSLLELRDGVVAITFHFVCLSQAYPWPERGGTERNCFLKLFYRLVILTVGRQISAQRDIDIHRKRIKIQRAAKFRDSSSQVSGRR